MRVVRYFLIGVESKCWLVGSSQKGPGVRNWMMVLVFAGLSATVAAAICRTWNTRLQSAESGQENLGPAQVLGPNEHLPQILAKDSVAASVIRGDVELVDAAKTFRELSIGDPNYVRRMSAYYPNADEIEIFAQSVICHVRVQLQGKPEFGATVERLEAKLATYREQNKVANAG